MSPLVVCAIIKYAMKEPLTQEEEDILEEWRSLNKSNLLWFELIRMERDLPDGDSGRLLREFLAGYPEFAVRREEALEELAAEADGAAGDMGEAIAGGAMNGGVAGDRSLGDEVLEWRRSWRRLGRVVGWGVFLAVLVGIMWFMFSGMARAPRNVITAPYSVAFLQAGRFVDLGGWEEGGSIYFGRIRIHKMAKDSVEITIADRGDPHDRSEELPALMIMTHSGHTLRAVMPDSTVLWLNASSELVLTSAKPEAWGRSMNLEGEGYFEVRKRGNGANAFTVLTPTVHVVCLGTDFNVRTYASDDKTRVSLVNGKLRLENDSAAMLLESGQQVQVDWNGMSRLEIRVSTPPRWKDGFFDLPNATIDEVFGELERWYNVRFFRRTSVQLDAPINFNVSRADPINVAMGELERIAGLHYEIHNDSVYVWQ